jgi:hypothetical protein
MHSFHSHAFAKFSQCLPMFAIAALTTSQAVAASVDPPPKPIVNDKHARQTVVAKPNMSPLSVRECTTVTLRQDDDIVLRDPEEWHYWRQGVHLRVGETLCIRGRLGGDYIHPLENISVVRGVATPGTMVALRLTHAAQGLVLQVATNSSYELTYRAQVPIEHSRLLVQVPAEFVKPNGSATELWPTDADEVWLTNFWFEKREPHSFSVHQPTHHDISDRRYGFAVGLQYGIARANFAALNRTLAQEGYGQFDANHANIGGLVDLFCWRVHLGLHGHAAPASFADTHARKHVSADWSEVGIYAGFDVMRWHSLTTLFQVEWLSSNLTLSKGEPYPSFAATSAAADRVNRIARGLGITLGHDLYQDLGSASDGAHYALTYGLRLGYVWQLNQNSTWTMFQSRSNDSDLNLGPTPRPGPPIDITGFRIYLNVGLPIFAN